MWADLITDLALAAAFLTGAVLLVLGVAIRRRKRRAGASGGAGAAILGLPIVGGNDGGHCSPSDGASAGGDGG